eukprot:365686-Chlamydomonas_euryale.AAC.4
MSMQCHKNLALNLPDTEINGAGCPCSVRTQHLWLRVRSLRAIPALFWHKRTLATRAEFRLRGPRHSTSNAQDGRTGPLVKSGKTCLVRPFTYTRRPQQRPPGGTFRRLPKPQNSYAHASGLART